VKQSAVNSLDVELIPRNARRILCLGLRAESLVAEVRQIFPEAVVSNGAVYDDLEGGAIEPIGLTAKREDTLARLANSTYDCVLLDDALEYATAPDQLLVKCAQLLAPDGKIIASVSNLRHHKMVSSLLRGRVPLWRTGRTGTAPIRFFTRRELEKVFDRSGFGISKLVLEPDPRWDAWNKGGRTESLDTSGIDLGVYTQNDVDEFHATRIYVAAHPTLRPKWGLTSIVLVTYNQIGYTHRCLESIRFRTDAPYELIVVDNGSTDGTLEYLRSQGDIQVIENGTNRGFPAAANQGIVASRGEQVLLLNNDTIVSTGWLDRLLEALRSNPSVGLAGPCSNEVSGEQRIPVPYTDLASMDGFAWQLGRTLRGQILTTDRLVGFCLLIRRSVTEKIGLLDERFGIGNYEDDDYCLRARKAGFQAVIARDSFVHHFGHRTFIASGVNYQQLMDTNNRLFQEKWSESAEAEPLDRKPAFHKDRSSLSTRVGGDGGLVLIPQAMRLSACLIVRDNESTIRPCLESIRPWVDELIVVDTGSIDQTPLIAEELGASVFYFPWCDDFSAARNESLRHARGHWLFWMDSDDTIDAECGQKLRALANRNDVSPDILGFVMQVHCPGHGATRDLDVTIVDHIKMFRNDPALRFEGRIHEQILPAIRQSNGKTEWTDIFVVHSGSAHGPEARDRKLQRDLRILTLDLAERPGHPFVLFNLGMTYADMGDFRTAVTFLNLCLAASLPDESHVRKAHALLIGGLIQLGEFTLAEQQCAVARKVFPDDPELLFRHAILAHHAGKLSVAETAYQTVLRGGGQRHFSSIDRGIVGFKARHNLALVYEDMGDFGKAERQWEAVVQEMPSYREGWRGLLRNRLHQNKHTQVEATLRQMRTHSILKAEVYRGQAELATVRGNQPQAKAALVEGTTVCADDEELLQSLCQHLFEHGDPQETVDALRRLVATKPRDASARHNLGTVLLRAGDAASALRAYDEAIRLRPNEARSFLYRSYALQKLGRTKEAEADLARSKQLDLRFANTTP